MKNHWSHEKQAADNKQIGEKSGISDCIWLRWIWKSINVRAGTIHSAFSPAKIKEFMNLDGNQFSWWLLIFAFFICESIFCQKVDKESRWMFKAWFGSLSSRHLPAVPYKAWLMNELQCYRLLQFAKCFSFWECTLRFDFLHTIQSSINSDLLSEKISDYETLDSWFSILNGSLFSYCVFLFCIFMQKSKSTWILTGLFVTR